jgi:hypothetical protein
MHRPNLSLFLSGEISAEELGARGKHPEPAIGDLNVSEYVGGWEPIDLALGCFARPPESPANDTGHA